MRLWWDYTGSSFSPGLIPFTFAGGAGYSARRSLMFRGSLFTRSIYIHHLTEASPGGIDPPVSQVDSPGSEKPSYLL